MRLIDIVRKEGFVSLFINPEEKRLYIGKIARAFRKTGLLNPIIFAYPHEDGLMLEAYRNPFEIVASQQIKGFTVYKN